MSKTKKASKPRPPKTILQRRDERRKKAAEEEAIRTDPIAYEQVKKIQKDKDEAKRKKIEKTNAERIAKQKPLEESFNMKKKD